MELLNTPDFAHRFDSKTAALKFIKTLKFPNGGHYRLTAWYFNDGTIGYYKVDGYFVDKDRCCS